LAKKFFQPPPWPAEIFGKNPKMLFLVWFKSCERWPEKKKLTISLNCGVNHNPGKIEYNCRYFIMSFRKHIGEKEFGKNDFQGTGYYVSAPIAQYLKFKITAA
jgi:hypothetical protein